MANAHSPQLPGVPTLSRRLARLAWLLLVTLVGAGLVSSMAVGWKMTHRRDSQRPEPVPTVTWAQLQPVRLTAVDGVTLGAWYGPGRADAPGVILLHGNGGTRREMLDVAELVAKRGAAVLLLTLRAHGDSDGAHNDIGWSARHDVIAAVAWLETTRPGRPIVIHGRSLGAAAATYAAGELGERVHGYILECPYQDLRHALRNRLALSLPALLAPIAYGVLTTLAPLFLPDLDLLSPQRAVAQVPASVPVLILAGELDRRAPPEEARALWREVATHGRLVVVPGADHPWLRAADEALYEAELTRFLGGVR